MITRSQTRIGSRTKETGILIGDTRAVKPSSGKGKSVREDLDAQFKKSLKKARKESLRSQIEGPGQTSRALNTAVDSPCGAIPHGYNTKIRQQTTPSKPLTDTGKAEKADTSKKAMDGLTEGECAVGDFPDMLVNLINKGLLSKEGFKVVLQDNRPPDRATMEHERKDDHTARKLEKEQVKNKVLLAQIALLKEGVKIKQASLTDVINLSLQETHSEDETIDEENEDTNSPFREDETHSEEDISTQRESTDSLMKTPSEEPSKASISTSDMEKSFRDLAARKDAAKKSRDEDGHTTEDSSSA